MFSVKISNKTEKYKRRKYGLKSHRPEPPVVYFRTLFDCKGQTLTMAQGNALAQVAAKPRVFPASSLAKSQDSDWFKERLSPQCDCLLRQGLSPGQASMGFNTFPSGG